MYGQDIAILAAVKLKGQRELVIGLIFVDVLLVVSFVPFCASDRQVTFDEHRNLRLHALPESKSFLDFQGGSSGPFSGFQSRFWLKWF